MFQSCQCHKKKKLKILVKELNLTFSISIIFNIISNLTCYHNKYSDFKPNLQFHLILIKCSTFCKALVE
jgi:hypothetical protein